MNLLPHNKIIKGIHYLPTFIFLIFPNKNRYKIIKLDCRVFFFLLNTHDFKSIHYGSIRLFRRCFRRVRVFNRTLFDCGLIWAHDWYNFPNLGRLAGSK